MAAPTLFVDGDACPVKDEVYRVGQRTGCPVIVVANSFIRTPPGVRFVTVDAGADETKIDENHRHTQLHQLPSPGKAVCQLIVASCG